MEADDGLAIAQTYFNSIGVHSVIVSEDKDLLQVTGWHYNTNKSLEPMYVDDAKGHEYLWRQVITGDKTDNIPGVSQAIHETTVGRYNEMIKATVEDSKERMKAYKTYSRQELYGDKTAAKYLDEYPPERWPEKAWELYVDKYEGDGGDEGYGDLRFLETFDLIYMLREHPSLTTFDPLLEPLEEDILFDDFD